MKNCELGRTPSAGQLAGELMVGVGSYLSCPCTSKLIPLRTVASMFVGSVFHHLYSNPTAGSGPAGQWLQSGSHKIHAFSRKAAATLTELLLHRQVATVVGSPTEVLLSPVNSKLTQKHSDNVFSKLGV